MKITKRLTALLLALMMIFGTLAAAAEGIDLGDITWDDWQQIVEDAKNELNTPVINPGGTNINTPEFPYENKLTEGRYLAKIDANLTDGTVEMTTSDLVTVASANAAQWQIRVGEELWVNVGGVSNTLVVNYAMLANSLKQIRQADNTDVVLAFNVTTAVLPENDTPTLANIAREGEGNTNPGVHAVNTTYNIKINYVFENNEIVSDPYTANIAEGSSFSATVTFPTVQGYLPYIGETQQNSIELNYTNVSEAVTINVVYKPTNVNYTVIHYQQNVDNDQYTEVARETKQGLTGSQVPEVAKTYEGFYNLLYEKPAIAADGSTVIAVSYDRYYYLMNFDMDGGYGTDPIYARYGASVGKVNEPTKKGYSFAGWAKSEGETDPSKAVSIPLTMPAESQTYYAIWSVDPVAKVTLVFWGENADDEKYSYLSGSTKEIYLKPGKEFTWSEEEMSVCDREVHTHTDDCIGCGKTEHTHSAVGGSCYTLTCTDEGHTHDTGCYAGASTTTGNAGIGAPNNPQNGYVSRKVFSTNDKVIYINGRWYEYSGSTDTGSVAPTTCGLTETTHTHTNACYTLTCTAEKHTHEATCYSCGKEQHTHNSDCYIEGAGLDSKLWEFKGSDTVTVAVDGSTVVNVYYTRKEFTLTFRANRNTVATIKAKWGQDISGEFNKAPFNTTYNGRAWECTESSKYGYALQTLDRMPQFDATFDLYNRSSNTLKTIYYYVENVGANVSHNNWPNNQNNFTLLKEVQTYFNYATYDEEYHEIEGFTRYSKNVAGFDNENSKDFENNRLYLYYLRNDYTLTFNNGYENVKDEQVQYQAKLDQFNTYEPKAPIAYEPGSVEFGGWYQNPQCTGEEYKLDEHTMPATDVILYAKWVPVNHTVTFYLDQEAYDAGTKLDTHPAITVPHGELATPTPADPVKGEYEFIGWFYMDGGVEKAFDFANMQVRKDMDVYAKWSSNTLKEYTVQYVLKDDHSVKVADDLTGSGLAGTTKTFDAKGGTDLYAAYQEGYFPTVQSQSLLLDIDKETLTITFEYVPMPAVPYTVRYVTLEKPDGEYKEVTIWVNGIENGKIKYVEKTAYELKEDKVVRDNRKAVVTETFEPISGYMPDAYQKRLVVVTEPENGDNTINFIYTKDTERAYYKITHYIQNTDGTTWTEHASSQVIGDIDTRYTASPMTIPGYTYDHIEYVVNEEKVTDVTAEGAKLTVNGLEINLYYVRNEYPYEFKFLEQGTDKVLADSTTGNARYEAQVTENAKTIPGYKLVSDENQAITIAIEDPANVAKINVKIFYYQEETIEIKYQVVGPDGCGTLNSYLDSNVKVFSGPVNGSTPTAGDGFKFVGWYKDEACTEAVDATWVDANNKITPAKTEKITVNGKEEDAYKEATYYAKFEWDITSLTIKKEGSDVQDNESFIFNVTGGDTNIQVVINGKNSVTINGLKVGTTYTVTEVTSWSNRYGTTTPETQSIILDADANKNVVTVTNSNRNNQWLHDEDYHKNSFNK